MADTKISLMPTLGQADVVATTDVVPVVTIGPPNVNKKVTPQALVGASVSNLTQTWNDAGTVFSAVKMNVTDSASNASSTLLDLQVGGASQFKVSKAGVTSVGSTLELGHASDTTLSRSSAGVLAVEGIVVPTVSSTNTLSNKTLASPTITGTISGTPTWGSPQQFSTIELGSGTDTTLSRASAGILAVEGVAVPTISSSDTLSNKTLSSPVLSGTVAGTPTYSGSPTYNARLIVNARNSDFKDENFGGTSTGVWGAARFYADAAYSGIVIQADTSQSASLIRVINSTDTADLAAMSATGSWSVGGVAVPTISSTDTLSNKTLSSPTLSGTVSGSPTFSGGVTFSRGTNHEVVVFNQTNPATYNLDVQWQDNGAVRWLQSVRTNSNDDFWTYNIARASADISISAASGVVAMANGATGQSGAAIPTISSSDTLSNKTLSGPVLSGNVSGTPTFTGNVVFSGTPRLVNFNIGADSDIYVYESATNTLTFRAGGSGTETYLTIKPSNVLELGGVAIPTISSTDTLSNKTLFSPTINGGTFSTTSPIFSVSIDLRNDLRITDAGTNRWAFGRGAGGGGAVDDMQLYNYGTATVAWRIPYTTNIVNFLQTPTVGGVAVPTISSSDTLSNKTLSSPTLSGTVAGTPTYSGTQTISVASNTTNLQLVSAGSFTRIRASNSDNTAGYLNYDAKVWKFFGDDGTNNATSLLFFANSGIEFKGVAIPTISSTDTLSNKTLSSPTLSGTVAGTPTFSGGITFTAENITTMPDPAFQYFETDAPADEKRWRTYMAGGTYAMVGLNDAASDSRTIFSIDRNGYTAYTWDFGGVTTLTRGGVAIPTISSTDTLSNKTLSSPTLSGTVAGASTFSGNTIFSGGLNSSSSTGLNLTYASGAQGSSLSLARPATSTSLAGNVVIDVNGNSLRIYEVGGSFRGVTVDLTTMGSQSPLATLDTAQTLSNKTLSSPTLSGTTTCGAINVSAASIAATINSTNNAYVLGISYASTTGGYIGTTSAGNLRLTDSTLTTMLDVNTAKVVTTGTLQANKITSAASPDTSSNSITNVIFRVAGSNVGAAGYGIDMGVSNSDGTSWIQSRDHNNYATNTTLRLNPNGGGATLGGVAIPTISSTDTLSNKTLSSPTLSGTVAGSPALTGQWQWSGGNDAAYWHGIVLAPTDAGNNKPSLYITHTSPSAYAIGLYDGTDTDGTIAFNCGVLNHNGAAITTTTNSQTLTNKTLSGVTIADNTNIVLNTTNGTKIGTATSQKLGFFNATPVVQPTAVADATDAASVITQLNALLTRMRNLGLIAT